MQAAIEPNQASLWKKERPFVRDIREQVLATLQEADPLPLQRLLIQVYVETERAIGQCRTVADKTAPEDSLGHGKLYASVEAYHSLLDTLEALDDAVEADDPLALYHAFAALESAAHVVDGVVEENP